MAAERFSWTRWWAIVLKEFLQLRRDRLTFAMIIGLPIVQMALFGYAINTDPRNLPTYVVSNDHSEFSRRLVSALQTSSYFHVEGTLPDAASADQMLRGGQAVFVLHIPPDFSRQLVRGEQPALLLDTDASDPLAPGMALAALNPIVEQVSRETLAGPLSALAPQPAPFSVMVHRLYNPENNTQYNVVPGLMGVVLTLTMVMMTGLAMTRERERGTMENLLATPVRPLEVISGKIIPYVAIGMVQSTIILLAAYWVFHVPFVGSVLAVYLVALLFIAANLTVGITLSSLAGNQLQAMQLTIFYFLPSILLSGFMFPFRGMPGWAQVIGEVLPLTHFNRLIRGILLKGSHWGELWPDIWPLLLFTVLLMGLAVTFYRRTLD